MGAYYQLGIIEKFTAQSKKTLSEEKWKQLLKVLVEEFSIEPKLINWLFRHANLDNCLAGAIISTVN